MDDSKFMKNFKPDFTKDYNDNGREFTVQVQNMGFEEGTDKPLWHFAILVNGHVIEAGPYQWRAREKTLTDEHVANHLASYWGPTPTVQQAQRLPINDLNIIVKKCALYMFTFFLGDAAGKFDYDVVHEYKDDDGWIVVLRPIVPDIGERLLIFENDAAAERGVKLSSYTLDRDFFFNLF